ncbi:MAG: rod shape-determining protein MreD [Pseudomonadales bacterium]|nr:rod shape-determining protein MreD [Pseudomonadales bacterium]
MEIRASGDQLGPVIVSLLLAAVLAVVPVPEWATGVRPAWVPLVLIYWVIAMPHRIGVMTGWSVGLLLDALTGAVLGQNALGLALIAYIAYVLHLRIRVFPVWQQCLAILVLVGFYQLVSIMVMRAVQITPWTFWYWASVLVSALAWPLVTLGLGYLRGRRVF